MREPPTDPRPVAPGWRPVAERIIEAIIAIAGWSGIGLVFAILTFVVYQALPVVSEGVSLGEVFGSTAWRPESSLRPQFGLLALLAGTVAVTASAMVLAVPAGIGTAVFLSEFCGRRSREALKVIVELLAAIPSVVWGFVGYMVLSPLIIEITGAPVGVNVLNGAVILAFMSVPIIVSMGEDALKSVPDAYREAAIALGASRWQLIWRVLLPAARQGLLGAALLGVGRAVGETMAVLMVTGHSVRIPHSLFDPVRTLTATVAAELGEAVVGGTHYRVLFLIGAVLLLISLVVNVSADLIIRRTSVEGGR
jgi:phosphate transport system permease protein